MAEILVKIADRAKDLVIFEADDFISFFPHGCDRIGGADRDRKNEFAWLTYACRAQSSSRCCAGCNTIVDDDDETPFDIDPLAIADVALPPPLDFGKFTITYVLKFSLVDARKSNDVFISNDIG